MCARIKTRRDGFTLLELVMVILVLAIITVGAVPQLRGLYRHSELARAVTGMVELLNYAHQRAVLEQQPQVVLLDVKEGRYWMEALDEERASKRKRRASLRSSSRRRKNVTKMSGGFPKGYEVAYCYLPLADEEVHREEARLTFYPDGSCDGLHVTVAKFGYSDHNKDMYLFIKMDSNTGKIKMKESEDADDAYDFYLGYWTEDEEEEKNG